MDFSFYIYWYIHLIRLKLAILSDLGWFCPDNICFCSGYKSCQHTKRVCEPSCKLWCHGELGCQNLTILCPSGSSCLSVCYAKYTCQHATFIGDWKVNCVGNFSCNDYRICKNNTDNCYGTYIYSTTTLLIKLASSNLNIQF